MQFLFKHLIGDIKYLVRHWGRHGHSRWPYCIPWFLCCQRPYSKGSPVSPHRWFYTVLPAAQVPSLYRLGIGFVPNTTRTRTAPWASRHSYTAVRGRSSRISANKRTRPPIKAFEKPKKERKRHKLMSYQSREKQMNDSLVLLVLIIIAQLIGELTFRSSIETVSVRMPSIFCHYNFVRF